MDNLFRLPEELLFVPLFQRFPCREHQIRSLAALISPSSVVCKNIVIYGAEATGKSTITEALIHGISEQLLEDDSTKDAFRFARVDAAQCITSRHLFERIIGAVESAINIKRDNPKRCETLAQLSVQLQELLSEQLGNTRSRFVLVLDAIDRQRDAPSTLLPALARFSEMIPCLTCVFIVTSPPAGFLRAPSINLHFPPYQKQEFVRILSLSAPGPIAGTSEQETKELWTKFCAAVHDSLIKSASRTLPSFMDSCHALWPRFTAPIVAGTYTPKEFSKLLVATRLHFQDESLLNPSIVSVRPGVVGGSTTTAMSNKLLPSSSSTDLTSLLPTIARLLLLAAYIASHNPTKHDLTLFSTFHHGRRRIRGGGTAAGRGPSSRGSKHRKIARKLLGSHAFVFERMMAIFETVKTEWIDDGRLTISTGTDGDVGMALATLASLRLLMRVGVGDLTDRAGKWRINVGWEAIRGISRSIGVDIEEWLIE